FVLQTIADIQSKSDIFETNINQTKDKCHLLESYNQKTSDEELAILRSLDNRWHEISLNSKHRDTGLKRVKGRFTEITLIQIDRLKKAIHDFAEKFARQGSGSIHNSSELNQEMKNLEKLYILYEQQSKSRELWSETLWRDLDVQILLDDIDNYIKELKKMSREIKSMPLAKIIEITMKEFRESIPLMADLKNDALRERHWKMLMKETQIEFDILLLNQDRGYVLGSCDEVLPTLDDHTMALQGMAASRFIGPFLSTVQQWEKSLSLIAEVIELWLNVQRKWMYLEGIFVSGDIRSQLPEEAKKFDEKNKLFKSIMLDTYRDPSIKKQCHQPSCLADLESIFVGLERSVQEHIIKMFDNVVSLRLMKQSDTLTQAQAMISAEKEEMTFKQTVNTEERVEDWMTKVLEEMRRTDKLITKEAVYYYRHRKSRVQWMYDYIGMVVLASSQIWWTWKVEDIFQKVAKGNKMGMKNYVKQLHLQFDLHYQIMIEKFNTVLIIDIHAKDIVDSFVCDSILDAREFEWESQLRFYWAKDTDDLVIRQCTGAFGYGYEYMGLNGRLVITPLTDRIYLIITQVCRSDFR
ncbi:unnamed protein product, partial [Didymodactylos carnosus]